MGHGRGYGGPLALAECGEGFLWQRVSGEVVLFQVEGRVGADALDRAVVVGGADVPADGGEVGQLLPGRERVERDDDVGEPVAA